MRQIVSPLSGILSPLGQLRSSVSIYAILNFEPAYVTDFGAEFYRKSGATSTFSDSITHSAASNATMVDSDGLLKWRPHNLLPYSEQFDNAAWVKANTTVTANTAAAPDGTIAADRAQFTAPTTSYLRQVYTTVSGASYTISCWVKSNTGSNQTFRLYGNGGPSNSDVFVATTEWQLFAYTYIGNGASASHGLRDDALTTADILVWGAHLYRSDLGGMVNNPDRGDSYVPTTTSAVYLPRRGHHVYNGDSWVNKGLLHESEQRVNLVTYSEDFTDASWSKTAVTFTATTATTDPSGGNGAYIFDPSTAPTSAYSIFTSSSTAGTLSVFFKEGTERYALIIRGTYTSGDYAIFDLQSGSVSQAPTYTGTTAGMIDCGNGWWRCWLNSAQATSTNAFSVSGASTGLATASSGYVYIYGAQLEAGSTPSSYIPNAGATSGATREAETLTVPAANLPWPSPVVIGEELVTNGTFETDTDWTKGTGWSISGGVASNDGTINAIYQSKAIEAGKLYACTIDITFNSAGVAYWRLGNSTNLGVMSVDATSYTQYLIGSADGNYIGIFTNTNITIDNISVKEINPLSVSIQMQGEMTYADEDDYEVYFHRWFKDTNTYVQAALDATSTRVGMPRFFQNDVSYTVAQVAGLDAYTPGVNVPFNIASRHGSTFINGAVDGVALTADTTPVALPDLSATDLQLGYDYMGTISLFRVWADDLTDAGIADASAPSTVPSL